MKWESGFLAEAEDETIDDHNAGPDFDVAKIIERPRSQDSLPTGDHSGASDTTSYKKTLASLKQKEASITWRLLQLGKTHSSKTWWPRSYSKRITSCGR